MSPSTNNSSFNNSYQSSFCKTIKICKSKKEIQLTCMFSYKASWLQILTPWLQHAYLVTWKRGALMPTRTTIFFCSTSRSTRGRWQPVQVFFFGSKLNQTQHWRMCSRVLPDFLPKILSFSRGQKFALMNCVSEQMTFLWSFSEFFASISSLREQAFLFFSILSGIHGAAAMQTLIFLLPLVSWTSVSFNAIKLHTFGFIWSKQLAYLNVGKRKKI